MRLEEPDALAGLVLEAHWPDPSPRARPTIYRFNFPPQDHAIKPGASTRDPETEKSVGTVVHLDDAQGVIDIKCRNTRPAPEAQSLIPCDFFNPRPKPDSLQRLARWVINSGIDNPGPFKAPGTCSLGAHRLSLPLQDRPLA